MKIKQFKDLRSKEVKEITSFVSKQRLELSKNAVKIAKAREKNIKNAWKIRKEIAQAMTVLNEKRKISK